jgi:hypothetical protein
VSASPGEPKPKRARIAVVIPVRCRFKVCSGSSVRLQPRLDVQPVCWGPRTVDGPSAVLVARSSTKVWRPVDFWPIHAAKRCFCMSVAAADGPGRRQGLLSVLVPAPSRARWLRVSTAQNRSTNHSSASSLLSSLSFRLRS